MKRVICLVLCFLLCGQVFAAKTSSLEREMQRFIHDNGLDESNFALSYYNLSTDESYSFNAKAFFAAGRVWTFPLHMYYYEQEAEGAFEPALDEPEEFLIGGMTLEACRYRSIILADDSVSERMRTELGSLPQYQELINTYYGRIAMENLPKEYWDGSSYSAEFLMNCLRNVVSRPEKFGSLMANYQLAQKADAFAGNNTPYHIVQVRGEDKGMVCALAEVSALQPYLIVAFVSEAAGGDSILAELTNLLCSYIEKQAGVEATVTPTTQRSSDSDKLRVPDQSGQESILMRWFAIAFGAAAIVAIITGVTAWVIKKRKKKRHHR